jgi:5-methyltetrahydrofolate--homocysteine methyltransferase
MEAGLKVAGGKCILNSTNYEDGDERFFKVLELAKQYGAGIVVGTIDEDGMARTAEKKFQIAQRAYRDALEYGIPARELFFDTLALPISTGIEEDRVNGKETIESIRMIRENLPGCHIMLGVSNVSFGLNPAARVTLNSVFLHEAMQVGLDGAIVSAAKILPLAKIDPDHQKICRDLIYDHREYDGDIVTYDPLTKLTTLFEGKSLKKKEAIAKDLPIEEQLQQHIIDGERIGLEDALETALKAIRTAGHHQHLFAGRHEGSGGTVRLWPDAAALCAAVGPDHESRRRLPGTLHGKGRQRRLRQGHLHHRHG